MKNCVDIVRPFMEEMWERPSHTIQVIGGSGSAALALSSTMLIPEERGIIAREGLVVPQFRNDGNKRDLDILVLNSRQPSIDKVSELAKGIIGDELEISVFGLKPLAMLRHSRDHPWHASALSFVSDRYVEETGGNITRLTKALFPFALDVDVSTLETWWLQIGNDPVQIPVPHPGATLLNYLTRSISGLRPKDTDKILGSEEVAGLARTVFASNDMKEWVFDGPGRNLVRFAQLLHGLRQPVNDQRPLRLADGIELMPLHPEHLINDPAFMFYTDGEQLDWREATILQLAQMKSRSLHFLESYPLIVKYYQRYAERHAHKIVMNE